MRYLQIKAIKVLKIIFGKALRVIQIQTVRTSHSYILNYVFYLQIGRRRDQTC